MATRATTALRNAVMTCVVSGLALKPGEYSINLTGQPDNMSGQRFVSVHPGYWTNRANDHFDEQHGVHVTVSMRLQEFPDDRQGDLMDLDGSLEECCDQIARIVHSSMASIMTAANAVLAASESTNNGFVEPLRFRDCSPPMIRGPEWFRVTADEQISGLSRTLRFLEARRIVRIF